jgi:adenine-specific DNA-methyltransferase
MTKSAKPTELLKQLEGLNAAQLRRLLVEHLTKQKLGLYWDSNAIARDLALNADVVLPRLVPESGFRPADMQAEQPHKNLIIEGDNFDALRLLRNTHAGKIRVIYIDPPYNTGNKDWVYNDRYVGANDRWRHSQWLEFLYQRLTLARDLLTSDGVILVSINDENRSRLELLMDEVFPRRRIGSLVWRTKDTGNDAGQRFSHVHEHVLIYANENFKFNGRATDRAKFRNPDNDTRGDWAPRPLTKAHSLTERENTYYPIQNPKTGYWYPCDPDSVWRFASETKVTDGQILRSETLEEMIRQDLIYFPPVKVEELMLFATKEELLKAIRAGGGPVLPKKKTQLLREDLPDIDDWIGRIIAPGRPSRKDFWDSKPEAERIAPLGSWIAGVNEELEDNDDDDESPEALRTTRGGVATDEIKAIFGSRPFQHPKPLTLLRNLLRQASNKDDTVLDFFAGSGTTGQAVLELNAEDGGNRRFILCSSTEATEKEPDKNICRDVCAERMRRVIQGYSGASGRNLSSGGEFAYLKLDKIEAADLTYEAEPAHAHQLLAMARFGAVNPNPEGAVQLIGHAVGCDVLLVPEVTADALAVLIDWPQKHAVARIAVYSDRPQTLDDKLRQAGVEANCYGIHELWQRSQEATQQALNVSEE